MYKIQDMEIVLSNRNAILAWLSHTAASVSFIGAAPHTRAASWRDTTFFLLLLFHTSNIYSLMFLH